MKKKFIMLFVSCIMVCSLAACSAEDIEGAIGAASSVADTIIEENADDMGNLIEEFGEAFKEEYKELDEDELNEKNDKDYSGKREDANSSNNQSSHSKEEIYSLAGKLAVEALDELIKNGDLDNN